MSQYRDTATACVLFSHTRSGSNFRFWPCREKGVAEAEAWSVRRRQILYEVDEMGHFLNGTVTFDLCCPKEHRFRVNAQQTLATVAPSVRVFCPTCAKDYPHTMSPADA
jgi:hypothetical protein